MSRNSKKHNWNPYTSDLQKLSVYPSIKVAESTNLKVGDVITIDIYDVDERGHGIVHYGGKKIIIPNAMAGSRARVKIVKVNKDDAVAHIIEVLSESTTEY